MSDTTERARQLDDCLERLLIATTWLPPKIRHGTRVTISEIERHWNALAAELAAAEKRRIEEREADAQVIDYWRRLAAASEGKP